MALTEDLDRHYKNPTIFLSKPEAVMFAAERVLGIVKAGEEITPETLDILGNPVFLIFGNSNVRVDQLQLVSPKDYQTVNNTTAYPGKSAMIDPYRLCNEDVGGLRVSQLEVLVRRLFEKILKRQDNAYSLTLADIHECGFRVFYVPTSNKLHVRLVYQEHIAIVDELILKGQYSESRVQQLQIPEEALVKLLSKFRKVDKIRD